MFVEGLKSSMSKRTLEVRSIAIEERLGTMADSRQHRYPRPPTPRLLEILRQAEEEARALRPQGIMPLPPTPERDKAIDELIEWHEGDNLDWDVIERAHAHRA